QAKGHYATAHTILQQAQEEAKRSGTLEQQILVHSHLGDILLAMQKPDAARESLEEMLILARRHDEPLILAHLLNNLGNALYVLQEYVEALNAYREVTELALRGGDPLLQIQALSNQVRVHLKRNDPAASLAVLEKALSQVQASLENHDKGFHLLSLGQLALRLQTNFQKDLPQVGSIAYRIFNEVLKLASQQQDKRLMSYAKGFLGQLYEREQRYQEATQLTRQAIFFAQDESDISYLWEWQQARLLQSQQDFTGAIRAYKLALEHLHPIRSRLFIGQRDTLEVFNERIRPVYFGLADLLLRQAAKIKEPETKTALLKQAREEIERLKLIELQEYFQSECLSAVQTQATELESRLDKHTAIFYPILFPDRTELLLSLPDGIHQVIIPVGADTLGEVVHQLRKNLQLSTSPRFIKPSTQLYQWLITPILPKLTAHDINTLIIVPDGSLRTVPLAALYDPKDKKFLMHRFALVTTPGLNLTDSRLLLRKNFKALLNGLSEGVQDFSPLPSVPDEIKNIGGIFEKNDILLDQKFLLENLNQSLLDSPYEVVHIASHGQFDSNPKKTFLLTYDSKLTMDRLQGLLGLNQLRKEPVELLTLSACQTAVGDERAALGLAGVAIKAGARSVIASLWFVNDESTAQLITAFYRNLIEDQSLSKAKALQKAQQKVAATQQFRHPAFWAPFLLIGNWL
ncbi:CHAT domain-containing protein, partial [Candidatus Marithioploca araucensis]|nr:CHAT domain-containing protein [Candidatus Marithioploca araucensis]